MKAFLAAWISRKRCVAMREQIRYSGSRHVEDIAANSRMLVEKALYMRCQSYLACQVAASPQTIFEVEDNRKKLKRSNMALRDTVQELAASRARLQAIFDNKLVGLLITNVDGGCLQTNARAAEILGRSVSELCGGEFKLPVELRAGKENSRTAFARSSAWPSHGATNQPRRRRAGVGGHVCDGLRMNMTSTCFCWS